MAEHVGQTGPVVRQPGTDAEVFLDPFALSTFRLLSYSYPFPAISLPGFCKEQTRQQEEKNETTNASHRNSLKLDVASEFFF